MSRTKSSLELPNAHAGVSAGVFNYGSGQWEHREHGGVSLPDASYCSYCGSVDPLTFLKLCEPGAASRMEVADWKYGWPHKIYIDVPNPDPSAISSLGGRYEASEGPYAKGGSAYTPPGPEEVAEADLTDEQIAILKRDGSFNEEGFPNPLRYHRFGTRALVHQKFYAVHLQDLPEVTQAQSELIYSRTAVLFFIGKDGRLMYGGAPRGVI